MSDDIYSILERLALAEAKAKPLPALLKKKPKEDFTPGVGGVEFAEDRVKEDVLSKVKTSFVDYLEGLENEIKHDKDLLTRKKQDLDLKKKELRDLELQQKAKVAEEPTQIPAGGEAVANDTSPTYAQGGTNTYAESAPVKTLHFPIESGDPALGSGGGGHALVEIHGDERDGFRIKRAGKELASRFASLEEAEMALEMFAAHRKSKIAQQQQAADYIEEK